MALDDDELRLGAAPPLVPGPSLEAEEKAMRGGRGGIIAAAVLAVLVVLGAVVALMMGDDNSAYETLGRNVNGATGEHYDHFWHCVFAGEPTMRSNEDFLRELNSRAEQGGKRFGALVQERCVDHLGELEARLDVLIPPDDLRPAKNDLVAAVRDLRGAWSDYLAYLDTLEGPYEADEARDQVNRIARAWFDYERAHGAINEAIRARLD